MKKPLRGIGQNLHSGKQPEPTRDKEATRFETPCDLSDLAMRQGIQPVSDWETLLGDFWPEQESVDDFINTVHAWRREAGKPRPPR